MKYLLIENNKMPVVKETEDINQMVNNLLNNGWIIENSDNNSRIYYIGGNGLVEEHPNRLMYAPDNPEYVEGYIVHKIFIIVKMINKKNQKKYTFLNEQEIKKYIELFDESSILDAKNLFD